MGGHSTDAPVIRVSTGQPASSPTPPPEDPPQSQQFAGLLFLGGLGSMMLGCVYALFRTLKKKRRSGRDRPKAR